jgi:hypothetical protein
MRRGRWTAEALAAAGVESWPHLWDAFAAEPALADLLAERTRRFGDRGLFTAPIHDLHDAALRDAGFQEVATVWQVMTNRVLLAIR